MDLSGHALTTVENVKTLLAGKDQLPSSEHDDLLRFLINALSDDVEQYCGWRHFEKATYTNERYARVRGQYLPILQYPILSVTAVSINGTAVAAGSEDDQYEVRSEEGQLYRADGWDASLTPPEEDRDILASYTAGYILPKDDLPGITTGAQTISVVAAARTYTRSAGSFVTEGFKAGDAVTMSGFTNAGNNGAKTVESVTALVLTVTSGTGLVNETGNGDEQITRTAVPRTLPWNLDHATAELVVAAYKLRDKAGLGTESFEGLAMTFAYWPAHVRATLDRYIRPRGR